jgi:hypothetical protein
MANSGSNAAQSAPVQRSYLCWLIASVVYVLGTVLFVLLTSSPGSLALFALIPTVIIAGLVVFFAAKMRAGRNWARIVLTVFAVLAILGNLPAIFGSGGNLTVNGQAIGTGSSSTVSTIVAVIALLLTLAALIFQWLPAARTHFIADPAAGAPPAEAR